MTQWIQKRRVRILAWILFFVFMLLSTVSYSIVLYGKDQKWYRLDSKEGIGFEDTTACQTYVTEGINYVMSNVVWLEDVTPDYLGTYMGAAFSYQIFDMGRMTADTRNEKSVFVDSVEFGMAVEGGASHYVTIKGYINLPVNPYEGCYAEYAIFNTFFKLRYLLLGLTVLFALLAAGMLAVEAAAAVQKGRTGQLRAFHKYPYDIVLLCCLIGYSLLSWFVDVVPFTILRLMEAYLSSWPYELYDVMNSSLRYVLVWLFLAVLTWYTAIQAGNRWLLKNLWLRKMIRRIPPLLYVAGILGVHALFLILLADYASDALLLLMLGVDALVFLLVAFFIRQSGIVNHTAQKIADGDLSHKVELDKLHLQWRSLGESLNRIGDSLSVAVEDRMKSERMKTELITNVSHDIKTPLTTIVNYIDLLKNGQLDESVRMEYLEILEKQSAKLKKLTEDVIEASKAASGALTVCLEPIDAVELLEQFFAEYEPRFSEALITPVFTPPAEDICLMADSVLLGRVLDNLFSNAVKYTQPDTRFYVDLSGGEQETILTFKNISREPLNISAGELMERFVRGDRSRHTDGSGLGLSIARSLTELMGGRLDLILDGDLFKVDLHFPTISTESK